MPLAPRITTTRTSSSAANASMMAAIWLRPRYDTMFSGGRSSHSRPTFFAASTS
jgi:hypothetical protein